MNHAQLKAFHAVAETGGFSSAAKILGLTQPAVTLQVQALEHRYKTKLFRRHGRKTEMTTSGKMLLKISKKIFSLEEEADALLSSLNAHEAGHLDVAATSSLRALPILSIYQREFPNVGLSLKTSPAHQIEKELLESNTDIAIQNTTFEDSRLFNQKIEETPLKLAVSTKHPWSQKQSIGLSELKSQTLITPQNYQRIDPFGGNRSFNVKYPSKQILILQSTEIVREAVANNLGVGFFTEMDIRWDQRIHGLEIEDERLTEVVYLVCLEEKRHSRLIDSFFELISTSSEQ